MHNVSNCTNIFNEILMFKCTIDTFQSILFNIYKLEYLLNLSYLLYYIKYYIFVFTNRFYVL